MEFNTYVEMQFCQTVLSTLFESELLPAMNCQELCLVNY